MRPFRWNLAPGRSVFYTEEVVRLALLFVGLAALPGAARADAPTVAQLRQRLAQLSTHHETAVTDRTITGIAYNVDVAERIAERFPAQEEPWRHRADTLLAAAEAGRDPYVALGGKIVNRAYVSPISRRRQGYAVYLPPNYDPQRAYPLMIVLHGGSSNGNLFLGVVLGNNMNWLEYDQHLWDDYVPQWTPDWIVVAPDGYGQVIWRWMGEQDVLDTLADVEANYHVDPDRVVLSGLSNGGMGAHMIGMRHAWRFSAVVAIAGAPSWLQYAGGRPTPSERAVMRSISAMDLLENSWDVDYRYFHGALDTGPMRPVFIEELDTRVAQLHAPAHGTWFADKGHDLLYYVHRHGIIYRDLEPVRRNRSPSEVRLVTGDYRAARQHWVTVTRIADYPQLARVRAVVAGDALTVETSNVGAFTVDLRDAPLTGETARIVIDGTEVYAGAREPLGHVLHLVKRTDGWQTGVPEHEDGLAKVPGLAGPIEDAYFGRMVHVVGTQNAEHTAVLREAAQKAARGWPLWLWSVEQDVIDDTAVTDELMRDATVVLYGSPGDNAVLERIAARLPIHADATGVVVGDRRYDGESVGARFIYPNPLSPEHYVIVNTGVNPAAVTAGNNLPDFVPDFVVYDNTVTRERQRLIIGRPAAREEGFFDAHWTLPRTRHALMEGGDDGPLGGGDLHTEPPLDTSFVALWPVLPVRGVISPPPAPSSFIADERDPAGAPARAIAANVQTFRNFRGDIAGSRWTDDAAAAWQVRDADTCLAALHEAGIPVHPHTDRLHTPVPAPVELDGPVGGIEFLRAEEPLILSCELAARLPEIVAVLARHGVTRVDVSSSYRNHPRESFHTFGLALDLAAFHMADGRTLRVTTDAEGTPGAETCSAPPPLAPRARELQQIACELAATHAFATVLTPNYNTGHRSHFHLDARPDDARLFVR